jgi:branched-chain amino acid transport system substrate-binding protein
VPAAADCCPGAFQPINAPDFENEHSGRTALRNSVLLAAAAAAAAVLAAGVAQASPAAVKIGVAGPFTGPNAALGMQLQAGAALAVADINARGGVHGSKLTEVVLDDACDPKRAAVIANALVADGVAMVDGHICPAATIAAGRVYADHGVLEIAPAPVETGFDQSISSLIFRLCGPADRQGKVAADYIAAHFKGAKVAVLNDDSAYGRAIADQVRINLALGGMPIIYSASYAVSDTDFSPLISRMRKAAITVVYLGGQAADSGLLIRQAAAQGFKPQYVSDDAAAALWRIAGAAAEGTLLTSPPPAETSAAAVEVVKELGASNEEPANYALYAYAAIQVWAEAANQARSLRPAMVARRLQAGGAWPSVLGPIRFKRNGDIATAAYAVYQWQSSSYVLLPMK